jgi:hypothetical protein
MEQSPKAQNEPLGGERKIGTEKRRSLPSLEELDTTFFALFSKESAVRRRRVI